MSSIILSRIPDICVRDDLVQHFKAALPSDDLDYVLFPLGKDGTKALVAFKTQRAVELILRQPIQIFGATLRSRPAPRQTYQRCTADVDPMIVASIPDLQQCIRELQQEFGVDVSFAHDGGVMVLSGSLMQIQCAQTKLDAIFRDQQESQARELLMVEQDLSTPRSQRSMSMESPELIHTQPVMRTNIYPQEAGRVQSARMSNTMTSGRLYEQRPHSSHEVRHSKDSNLTNTSRTVDSMFERSKPYSKAKKSSTSRKEYKGPGLPQGVLHDDSFTIRGVKIERHSENLASTMPISRSTDYNSTERDRNPLSQTVPTNAWSENFTKNPVNYSNPQNLTGKKSRPTQNSPPRPFISKSPPSRRKLHIPEAKEGLKVSKDGKEYLSLTIELDSDVMGYIKKIHKPEVKELELKHQVQFSNKWGDEVMDVRIITTDSVEEGGLDKLQRAKEEFVGFYQTVFYSVVKEVVHYDSSKVPESEVDAVTTAVGKAFASRVYVNSRNPGEIILVGSWDYLPLVREWVSKKLVHIIEKTSPRKSTERFSNGKEYMEQMNHTKTDKKKKTDKPKYDTWVQPQNQKRRNQRDRLEGSMPIKPSVEEGYVRASAALDKAFEDSLSSAADAAPTDSLFYEHNVRNDVKVFIYKADITQATQDVIVNASNESLHHIGTIALAISEAAGPQLQQQCTAYVTKHGPLRVSEVMSTSTSGHLQCKHVIHAVGPMWCLFTNKDKCAEVLKQTFLNTLFYANNKLKASSLVMPAISTGVYGVPLDVCTRAMYDAINTFSRAASSLKEIHVVDLEDEAAGMMSVIFQQISEGDLEDKGEELKTETELKVRTEESLNKYLMGEDNTDDNEDQEENMNELREDINEVEQGVGDVIQARHTEQQYASAPPVLGEQLSADWPESPPPTPKTRPLEEEGPLSPPPSPDEDYEEPLVGTPLIQVTQATEVHSAPSPVIRAEQVHQQNAAAPHGITSPHNVFSPRAESVASHHSDEIVQTIVSPEKFEPSGFTVVSPRVEEVHSARSIRTQSTLSEASPRSQTDFLSPRAESVASHHSEMIVKTDALDTKSQPLNLNIEEPKDDSIHSKHSSRVASVKSVTSPRSDIISPRDNKSPVMSPKIKTPRDEMIISGEGTPRSSSKAGSVKSDDITPRSTREGSEKSANITPRSSRAGSIKSGDVTPRSSIAGSIKSGDVTPRSSRAGSIKSGDVTPRSLKAGSIKSGDVTPRSSKAGSIKSGDVTPRSSKAGSIKSGDVTPRSSKAGSIKSGDVSPRSSLEGSHDTSKSESIKSGEVTPRQELRGSHHSSKAGSIKSGNVTPRSGIKSKGGSSAGSIKSGDVTPRSDKDRSAVTSPRHEEFQSPRAGSVKSNGTLTPKSDRQSPQPGSVRSPEQSPVDDFFKTNARTGGTKTLEQNSRRDSSSTPGNSPRTDIIQPQNVTDNFSIPKHLTSEVNSSNLIVPHSTPVVESSPLLGSEDSRQSSAMQESLPEAEFTLLKQVHLNTEKSTIEDITNRPRVKSPESSFSEVFDQKEIHNVPLLIRLVASSICIADKAGEIIRDIFRKGELGIIKKGPNDLQTEADRSAQKSIVASINKQFPNITVIGEETLDANEELNPDWLETSQSVEVLQYARNVPDSLRNIDPADVVVWVDPVDGTSEYTEGLLDHVTTLIGISVRGKAVAGIISQPYYNYESGPEAQLGRIIWGITGVGAFGFDSIKPPKEHNIICTTRSHSNKNVNLSVDSCDPTEVLRVGGSGHKVLLLLEGKAHGYVFASPGTKKWDTCAPEAVLHASGGKLTDIHGYFFQYDAQVQVKNTGGVLAACSKEYHEFYLSKIPKDVLADLHTDGPPVWQIAEQLTSKLKLVQAPLLLKLLAASVSIAERCGDIIRQIMKQGELGIVEKGINDLQTEADRSVQRCIIASLHEQFPGITIIGEEEAEEGTSCDWIESGQSAAVLEFANVLPEDLRNVNLEDVVVWVDPLDGTAEYIEGLLDHVTTLIGISVKGEAKAGVIYQPYYNYEAGPDAKLGRTIWGAVGLGSYGFEMKHPPQGENIICTTRSHSNKNVTMTIEACQPTDVLRVGGSGHKVLLILDGLAHAYVFATPGTKKWDTCAPEAVLNAVGGKMTDMFGNCFQYHASVQRKNNAGVLATASCVDHGWYSERIPSEVKEILVSDGPAPWQQQLMMSPRKEQDSGEGTPRY